MNYPKLIKKLLLLFFIIGLSTKLINYTYLQSKKKYEFVAAIIDKHQILEKTKAQRILLAGGSNVTFGINSEKIEKSTGIKTINTAILAPLGISFILCNLEKELKKDDIVLLSIEYDILLYGDYYSQLLCKRFYPACSDCVLKEKSTFQQATTELLFETKILHDCFWNIYKPAKHIAYARIEDSTNVYFRKAFNEHGDLISHYNNASRTFEIPVINIDYKTFRRRIEIINDFISHAEAKGCIVYMFHPAVAQSVFTKNKLPLIKYDLLTKKRVKAKYITRIDDFVYPDNYFFDSFYHLNQQGVEKRTNRLVEILKTTL